MGLAQFRHGKFCRFPEAAETAGAKSESGRQPFEATHAPRHCDKVELHIESVNDCFLITGARRYSSHSRGGWSRRDRV